MSNDLNAIINFINNQNQRRVNLEHNLYLNLIKNKFQSFREALQKSS